jgi:hypothetical protein
LHVGLSKGHANLLAAVGIRIRTDLVHGVLKSDDHVLGLDTEDVGSLDGQLVHVADVGASEGVQLAAEEASEADRQTTENEETSIFHEGTSF